MLKLLATINNRKTLLLGITNGNVKALKQDKPIVMDLQALVATVKAYVATEPGEQVIQDLVIIYGADEQDCRRKLEPYLPSLRDAPDVTAKPGETITWRPEGRG